MENRKFTQEVKDNWLEALKSGNFKQGFTELRTPNENAHCCIGVLGEITEGLHCHYADDKTSPYIFLDDTIGYEKSKELWRANDLNYTENLKRDYSNVIPLIEALEVQE